MKGIKIGIGLLILMVLGIFVYSLNAPRWTGFYYQTHGTQETLGYVILSKYKATFKSELNAFKGLADCQLWAKAVRVRPESGSGDIFYCVAGCKPNGEALRCPGNGKIEGFEE